MTSSIAKAILESCTFLENIEHIYGFTVLCRHAPLLNSLTDVLLLNTTVIFCSYSIANLFGVILVSKPLCLPVRDSFNEMKRSIFLFRQMPCKSQAFKENLNATHKPLFVMS